MNYLVKRDLSDLVISKAREQSKIGIKSQELSHVIRLNIPRAQRIPVTCTFTFTISPCIRIDSKNIS